MAIVRFREGFHGIYEVGDQKLEIGNKKIRPYDMTYGAVASCLYATLLGYAKEQGLHIDGADVVVDGVKRETSPTTLEHVTILIRIDSPEPMESLQKAMDYAMANCSMVATVAMVAKIDAGIEKK